ncbi:HigA family addiction module antitoxin [Permianibacter aggregans]|uniref:Xre family transcriptional regulator n=1 Tax=Permianibacter aggregans TaxID=1510150 RepID=A0A4R6URK6_9GAMM|nr:HigA family addiction module antitoxin [Permianibacter aggregans]QGX39840.1 addiction module antidote protein, HigA family [Permianibacter aggregans]TDQ45934.1 Xre family transcriptional regulator [Permianibacter aggregans]
MARMHNPPHPGETIGEDILPALNLTVTQGAEALGVSRKTLSAIINGRQGISAEMALRIARVFGGSPELWMGMQAAYELWQAEQHFDKNTLTPLHAA